jgi:hypothetical protein
MTINMGMDKMFCLSKKTDRSRAMVVKLKKLQMEFGGRTELDSSSEVYIQEIVEDDKMY